MEQLSSTGRRSCELLSNLALSTFAVKCQTPSKIKQTSTVSFTPMHIRYDNCTTVNHERKENNMWSKTFMYCFMLFSNQILLSQVLRCFHVLLPPHSMFPYTRFPHARPFSSRPSSVIKKVWKIV